MVENKCHDGTFIAADIEQNKFTECYQNLQGLQYLWIKGEHDFYQKKSGD